MIQHGSPTYRVLIELAERDRPVKVDEMLKAARLPPPVLRGLLHELRFDRLTSVKFYLTDSGFGDDVSWWKITPAGRRVLDEVEML
jgi:hypothetical protein